MAFVAVIGSGAIGGAIAQKLALRNRIAEVRLIDPHPGSAQGKALDILQSAPIEGFSTRVVSSQALGSAAGADAIVIADSAETSEQHGGEPGLALVRQLASIESAAPFVFGGSEPRELMARAVAELHVPRSRVLGTAPAALESALRAMTGIELDASGVEVQLRIVGAPPADAVVGWEEAVAFGLPLRSQLPPHTIAALTGRIPRLWPPGPYALASAAAPVIEAIVNGSRRRFSCFVAVEAGPSRNSVTTMPVEVGPRGIVRVLEPSLTRQERTRMENAIEK